MNSNDEMIGKKYGKLTVLSKSKNKIVYGGHPKITYDCLCECGNIKRVTKDSLKRGNTKSCGCIHKETISKIGKLNKKNNTYDLSGNYGVGFTETGDAFYFDIDDFDKIKDYYWNISTGYVESETNRIKFRTKMHRLIMDCTDSTLDIDHINHNKLDNRKENLRIVTRSQNQMNLSKKSNNTSGTTGVYFNKSTNSWVATIQKNKKRIYLGHFELYGEAVKARKDAECKYFGEYRFMEVK